MYAGRFISNAKKEFLKTIKIEMHRQKKRNISEFVI